MISSEQEWSEPKALIPFTWEEKAPVKEASWNNQNYPVPEKRSLIEIFSFTRLHQRETETAWAVFLFSGGSPRDTRNEGVSSRRRNKRDCLTFSFFFFIPADANSVSVTPPQDTPMSNRKDGKYINFGIDVEIQKPIEKLPRIQNDN